MTDQGRTLWAVLGAPPRDGLAPPPASRAWAHLRDLLMAALRTVGPSRRIRAPCSLWRVLGLPTRNGLRWRDLGDRTIGDLVRALEAGQVGTAQLLSWNLRWAVDPHSVLGAAKRKVLHQKLTLGYTCAVQETHW